MPVEIYGLPLSNPCRCALVTAEVLKLDYDFKLVDLVKGDNRKPEFLQMNPQHTVPTMKDGDFVLNESRVIMTYLARDNDKLYPKDVKTRCIVDQMLYYDMGTFYNRLAKAAYPVMFDGIKLVESSVGPVVEAVGWLDDFIKKTGWAAGTDHMTLADLSLGVTFATLEATGLVDLSAYPDLLAWHKKVCAAIPNYDKACGEGAAAFGGLFKVQRAK